MVVFAQSARSLRFNLYHHRNRIWCLRYKLSSTGEGKARESEVQDHPELQMSLRPAWITQDPAFFFLIFMDAKESSKILVRVFNSDVESTLKLGQIT